MSILLTSLLTLPNLVLVSYSGVTVGPLALLSLKPWPEPCWGVSLAGSEAVCPVSVFSFLSPVAHVVGFDYSFSPPPLLATSSDMSVSIVSHTPAKPMPGPDCLCVRVVSPLLHVSW